MPFTLAHNAAVLPFLRHPLVPIALVAGAMAPDLPYFVMLKPSSVGWLSALLSGVQSHQFTHILDVGLPLALVLAAFLWVVDRPIRWALGTHWFPEQTKPVGPAPSWAHPVLWTFLSLLIGLLTHLIWDSFTHSTGWVVRHVPVLALEPVPDLPLYRILQHVSTLAGLTVLILWHRHRRRIAVPTHEPRDCTYQKVRTILLAFILLGPAALMAARAMPLAPAVHDYLSAEMFFQVVILRGGAGLLVAALLYGLAWHTVSATYTGPGPAVQNH
ncbi:DUF4184 family protein [Paeniglutamicibacter antarcticus]|uniref:DUF4184 family protein n=1 Tax=Paeniglutamicibacter antarcticus TaxID=494023 RepID=A0ABP9TMC8_9MICC